MATTTIDKTSATTKGGTHLNSNNYNTSCTRSSRGSRTRAEIAKDWMLEEFGFYIERWTVSPEDAREILDDMCLNRKVKASGLSRYAATMEKGRWRLSPQGLMFDKDLKLIDGQHRLEAVVRSGITTDFLVFIGVPQDLPIDKSIPRVDADSLRIRGVLDQERSTKTNTSLVKAFYEAVLPPREFRCICEDDIGAFINKYADEVDFSRNAAGRGASHGIGAKASIRAAILAAVICGVDKGKIEEMMAAINSGFISKDQSSAKVMRDILTTMKMTGGVNMRTLEGMMEEAIFDYVHGKERKQRYRGQSHPYANKISVEEVLA